MDTTKPPSIPLIKKSFPNKHFFVGRFFTPSKPNFVTSQLQQADSTFTKNETSISPSKLNTFKLNERNFISRQLKSFKKFPSFDLLDFSNGKKFRGESESSEYSHSIFEFAADGTVSCFPATLYKFLPHSDVIYQSSHTKEESKDHQNINMQAALNQRIISKKVEKKIRKREETFMAKLYKDNNKNPHKKISLFDEENNLDGLLKRQQAGREISQVEATGEVGMEEASDDEGQFEDERRETYAAPEEFEDDTDDDEEVDDAVKDERRRFAAILSGEKSSKEKPAREEMLSDISDSSNTETRPADPTSKKSALIRSITEEKVAKIISRGDKVTIIDLIRELGITSADSHCKPVLGGILKKVSVMKSIDGRKFLELKPDYASLYAE